MSSDAQYRRDNNLATRIAFHEIYTQPYVDFSQWVFDHIALSTGQSVLELGCGNGEFWARNADQIPDNLTLVLSDKSPGMVQEAKRRLSKAGVSATYLVASAEDLDIEGQSFDVIVAKHMLYHVPEPQRALSRAKRLLKPGGRFCASTNSGAYMQQLQQLVTDEGLSWFSDFSNQFTLENGTAQLATHFADVRLELLDGKLVVPDADAVLEYVMSTASLFPEPDLVVAACEKMQPKIQTVIDQHGAFTISKRAGVFLCR